MVMSCHVRTVKNRTGYCSVWVIRACCYRHECFFGRLLHSSRPSAWGCLGREPPGEQPSPRLPVLMECVIRCVDRECGEVC